LDAIALTCRVCGQCGVAHSAASAAAIRALTGIAMPRNVHLCSSMILATETVISHLAHFYLSFAPDLVGPPYDDPTMARFRP